MKRVNLLNEKEHNVMPTKNKNSSFKKNFIFTIGIVFMLTLSIQPIRMYDDSWMIGSYFCHMCILFLYMSFWVNAPKTTSFYQFGAHCSITALLMLLSIYPFLFTSDKFTDFIYKYWEYQVKPYEGGILVTLCVLISEFLLFILLCDWILSIKKLSSMKKIRKINLTLGILLPIFFIFGYATYVYMVHYTKERKKEEAIILEKIKEDTIKFRNDSINKELAKMNVDLSFGKHKLGASKSEDNGKPFSKHLLGREIKNLKVEEYHDIIYKITVVVETTYSPLFIKEAVELYTKKYGETGTYGKWYFKNGGIEIEHISNYTTTKPVKKQGTRRGGRFTYTKEYTEIEETNHDIVHITYIDYKIDSIVKQEKVIQEELQKKEYEERKRNKEKEEERQKEIQKQREYEMI